MNEFYRPRLVIDNTSILLAPEKCNAVILQAALKQCLIADNKFSKKYSLTVALKITKSIFRENEMESSTSFFKKNYKTTIRLPGNTSV
jgi:hypothetical protein